MFPPSTPEAKKVSSAVFWGRGGDKKGWKKEGRGPLKRVIKQKSGWVWAI